MDEGITADGPLSRTSLGRDGLSVEHLAWVPGRSRRTCTFEVVASDEGTPFFADVTVHPGAAVDLGLTGVPPTVAYRYDHAVGLEFPRDPWAIALCDAIDELDDFTSGRGLVALLERDLVAVVDTEPDLGRDLVAIADTLASALGDGVAAGRLTVPAGPDPSTPPELEYLTRFVDGIIVPSGAAQGAVRVHRREEFGPETESRMAVTWRVSPPEVSPSTAPGFVELRTSAVDGRVADEGLAPRALSTVVGDARSAVSGVAIGADGAVAVVGIDDPVGRHDADVARAAERLRDHWPLPPASPGLAALIPYLTGADGAALDPSAPPWGDAAVTSRDGCSSITAEGLGPDGSDVVAAWFTRQRPGPAALVDLTPAADRVEVVVQGGNDDDLVAAAERFSASTPEVAPTRIHASADLVFAVGWPQPRESAPRRRFGRRSARTLSPGPDEAMLVRLLTSIPRHDLPAR